MVAALRNSIFVKDDEIAVRGDVSHQAGTKQIKVEQKSARGSY